MENVNDKVGKAAKGHQDPILMSVNVIGIANHFICKVNFLMILRALPFVVSLYNLQKGIKAKSIQNQRLPDFFQHTDY